MNIYTIGFTKKDAKTFFDFIKNSDIKTVLDVRLNNRAKNLEHYQSIYRDEILKLPCISEVEALMLISDIKKTNTLPV